jgi:hypothetical protein
VGKPTKNTSAKAMTDGTTSTPSTSSTSAMALASSSSLKPTTLLAKDSKTQADTGPAYGKDSRTRQTDQSSESIFLEKGLTLAAVSSHAVTYDMVSYSTYPQDFLISACKLDSSSIVSVKSPLSTHSSEMNNVYTVPSAPVFDAVQQVMNSDATLYSVIIPETKHAKSHFHIFFVY